MKMPAAIVLAALTSVSGLCAQAPTWAEQLHKTKTGAYPPGVEQRLRTDKQAREQKPQVQASDLFALLDHNRDGVINAQEWEQATKAATPDPNANR